MTFENFKKNALVLATLRYIEPSLQKFNTFLDGYSATFFDDTSGNRLVISYNCVNEQFNLHFLPADNKKKSEAVKLSNLEKFREVFDRNLPMSAIFAANEFIPIEWWDEEYHERGARS